MSATKKIGNTKLLIAAAAVILLSPIVTPVAAKQCETPLLSGPPIWPPFINPEADGQERTGYAIDFVETIFSEIEVSHKIDRAKPWPRVIKELETGELDMVFAFFDRPERREKYAYTEHWITDMYAVITYKGNEFDYLSVEDLRGRQGLTYNGIRFPPPLHEATVDNDNLTTVNDVELMHKMLRHKRVDYVIASVATFMNLLPEGYTADEFTALPASAVKIPVYMAIPKNSPCEHLLEAINDQIRKHRDELFEAVYSDLITN
ncbi:MAG: ABC transporter substrate-binding protein [Roseibium sp.]